jgi:hypothetical protein
VPDTPLTACLLHADIHAMDRACWDVTLGWYMAHQEQPPAEQRAGYQAAVERRMLDAIRTPAAATTEQETDRA